MAGVSHSKGKMQRGKGFRQTASVLDAPLRKLGEGRGFAVTRLLTQWEAILGPELAATCQPVKVSYSQGGFGATLTVLTTGAQAPMLEMQLPQLREKVNACYGYNAIARVRITQTAPSGFAEGQAAFAGKPKSVARPSVNDHATASAAVADIKDPELRTALAAFGSEVIHKAKRSS